MFLEVEAPAGGVLGPCNCMSVSFPRAGKRGLLESVQKAHLEGEYLVQVALKQCQLQSLDSLEYCGNKQPHSSVVSHGHFTSSSSCMFHPSGRRLCSTQSLRNPQ